MKRVLRFLYPLSILFVLALLYGLWCIIFSDKHGWLALSGITIIVCLAAPCLIAHVLVNMIVKKRNNRFSIQIPATVIIVFIYYFSNGVMGMPFINNIQNYYNNHTGNTIDTTTVNTNMIDTAKTITVDTTRDLR